MFVTINWKEWLQNVRLDRFADAAAATAYVDLLPVDHTALVWDTEQIGWCERSLIWDQQYTNAKLVQIFNSLGGEQVVKFKDTDAAVRRIETKIIDMARLTKLESSSKKSSESIQRGVSTMPREVKIGEFKQVRESSTFGKILKAYLVSEQPTINDLSRNSGIDPEKVVAQLRLARGSHGINHSIDAITRIVTVAIPVAEDSVFFSPKEKAAKSSRNYKVGEFKQVRRGGGLGKLVAAAHAGGTVAVVAAAAGKSEDETVAALKSLRRSHGIDHTIGDDGVVELKVPEGKDPFLPTSEAKLPSQPRTKNTEADERAARGEVPEKPIVTSETNKHRQKHFDKLAALADEGKWDDIAAFRMNGIDTYSKAINRYRDRLIAAHNAGQQAQAAE